MCYQPDNVQTVFNASTTGVAQETCRDLGHTSYSIAAAANAAETAILQGLDIYAADFDKRLAGSYEFHARLLIDDKTHVPLLCSGAPLSLHTAPTFEVGYAALALRRGLALPLTMQHIVASVRTMPNPVDAHMMVFETLTHGALPAPSIAARLSRPEREVAMP